MGFPSRLPVVLVEFFVLDQASQPGKPLDDDYFITTLLAPLPAGGAKKVDTAFSTVAGQRDTRLTSYAKGRSLVLMSRLSSGLRPPNAYLLLLPHISLNFLNIGVASGINRVPTPG
jgi:hypothetical protein